MNPLLPDLMFQPLFSRSSVVSLIITLMMVLPACMVRADARIDAANAVITAMAELWTAILSPMLAIHRRGQLNGMPTPTDLPTIARFSVSPIGEPPVAKSARHILKHCVLP